MSVSARVCGKTPSSRPVRKTIGNSRPLAACIVMSVTNDASGSSASRSLTSAMLARKSSSELPFSGFASNSRATPTSSCRFSMRARAVVGFVGLQFAQVARLFHHRDEQVGDRERLGLRAQVVDELGEALEFALLLRNGAFEQVAVEDGLPDRHARRVGGFEQRCERLLADRPARHVDDPAERDGVRRVDDVAQVREHVFDLGARVEADAADDPVGNALGEEAFFEVRATARWCGRARGSRDRPRRRGRAP